MKKIFITSTLLIASITFLVQSCSINKDNALIPSGAIAVFDAQSMLGTNSIPTTGCTTNTWINLINTSSNAAFFCSIGGQFEGAGSTSDPYRVTFDGVSTYLSTAINQQPAQVNNATWIILAHPTDINATSQALLSIDDHAGSFNRALMINNGMWSVYNGNGSMSATQVTPGTWQLIVVTFSPTGTTLYKNNVAFPLSAPTARSTTQNLHIGRSPGGNFDFYKGSIAWIGVFNRVLTVDEIKNSCKALSSRFIGSVCN